MKLGYICDGISNWLYRNDPQITVSDEAEEYYQEACRAIRKLVDETDISLVLSAGRTYETHLWVAFGLGAAVTGVVTTSILAAKKLVSK